MDFVVIESPEIHSSTATIDGKASPIVVSMGANDRIIAEPITSLDSLKYVPSGPFGSLDTEAHVDSSNVIHSDQQKFVKQKFVIIGGHVVPRSQDDSAKQDSALDIPAPESQAPVSHSGNDKFMKPHRKKGKPKKQILHKKSESVTGVSDGWSTEGEGEGEGEGIQVASQIDEDQSEVPGMLTDVSVSKSVKVSQITYEANVQESVNFNVDEITGAIGAGNSATTTVDIEQEHKSLSAKIDHYSTTMYSTKDHVQPLNEDTVGEIEVIPDTVPFSSPVSENFVQTTMDTSDTAVSSAEIEKKPQNITAKGYEIVSGAVRKVLTPAAPSNLQIDTAIASGTSTPLMSPARSISSHHSAEHQVPFQRKREQTQSYDSMVSRVRAMISPPYGPTVSTPGAAKKFVECGDMADKRVVGFLTRDRNSSLVFGPVTKENVEEPIVEASQFAYGKATPINQPSVREEAFDPFDKETPKSLKQLLEKNPPILDFLNTNSLRSLLEKRPNCFCGKKCAHFDGIVPVYVCGAFTRV